MCGLRTKTIGAVIRIYIDGVLETEKAAPGLVVGNNALDLTFGSDSTGSRPYRGGLDEVHLFAHALSEPQIEFLYATGAPPSDVDGDGVLDSMDAFPLDPTEWSDLDGDGIGDTADLDVDGDALPDAYEGVLGSDAFAPTSGHTDADDDGLTDYGEFLRGTDPFVVDTDGDGVFDGADAFPLDPAESRDTDRDGLPDSADLDDDADGMPDTWEQLYAFDPRDSSDGEIDSDGDGASNVAEYIRGTHPLDRDNDGVDDVNDVFPDDPGEWADADGDGLGDNGDEDDDNDSLPDAWELNYGLDPFDANDAASRIVAKHGLCDVAGLPALDDPGHLGLAKAPANRHDA